MSSTYTPPNLSASLKTLSSSVQDVMVSWHGIQTASLKTSSQPLLLRTSIAPLRMYLKTHWTDMGSHLQKCHDFGADVILFQSALEEEPDSAASVLEDLALSSNELCCGSEDLIRELDTTMECLASLTPQLLDALQGSSRCIKPKASSILSSEKLPQTVAFLGPPPDGLAAIAATKAGLTEIRNSLCMLHQLWIGVSKTCHAFMDSSTSIPVEYPQQLGKTWKAFQQEILSASVSIAKSVDAVVIEPESPTVSRRQPRRRGSSKSESSISASPPLQPRRMSSWDNEDEVTKGCWGFSFGERKRR